MAISSKTEYQGVNRRPTKGNVVYKGNRDFNLVSLAITLDPEGVQNAQDAGGNTDDKYIKVWDVS